MNQENNIFTKENTLHPKVGERRIMNDGSLAEIIAYNNAIDIYVQFPQSKYCETSNVKHGTYYHFCKGGIKNDFFPSILGVACKGNEKTKDENGNRLISYTIWIEMIKRCYKKYKINQPTYEKVRVCDDWLCYSNFKKWFNENYYEIENDSIALDKDIMQYDSKIYSPNTCIFVPKSINAMFRTKKQSKTAYLPIGISLDKRNNENRKFIVNAGINTKVFDTIDEAFKYYKLNKERQIKQLADQYKDKIPQKLYDRLMEYEVQIEYPHF